MADEEGKQERVELDRSKKINDNKLTKCNSELWINEATNTSIITVSADLRCYSLRTDS